MANMPGNTIRKSGKDLSNYIFDGYVTKCNSKTIDLDLIYEKIIELSTRFNIVSIQYDPYNSPVLVSRLKEYGLNCEKFQQSASRFNAPLKMLEEMIYNKQIKMKNPVLLWNFSNIVLYVDGNANIKIVKNKQNDSVDGCVALAMAVGGWLIGQFGEELLGIQQYIDAYRGTSI
jgi:phage terminase large subunit-like protein